MAGRLELAVQPVNPMDAATKVYVDSIATGARLIIGIINGTTGQCVYSGASGLPPGVLVDASTVPSGLGRHLHRGGHDSERRRSA